MRRTVAALCTVVVLALNGCAQPGGQETSMTPEQSLEQAQRLVDRTQQTLGGEWSVDDHEVALACTDADGRQFFLVRTQPEVRNHDDLETALRPVWEGEGLTIERIEQNAGAVQFVGLGDGGMSLTVTATDAATGIDGLSGCFPEDSWDPYGEYDIRGR